MNRCLILFCRDPFHTLQFMVDQLTHGLAGNVLNRDSLIWGNIFLVCSFLLHKDSQGGNRACISFLSDMFMDPGISQPFGPQFDDLLLIWYQLSRPSSVIVPIYKRTVLFQVCFDSPFCVAGDTADLINRMAF